jgi:hypothetical protein
MRRQTVVEFRCGYCRRKYPGGTPPALGYVERGRDGIMRPYRLKRVGQPLRPLTVGESPLGDARWALAAPGGTPMGRTARFCEPELPILTLRCRGCRRPPAEVPWEEYATLALAQGLREVDV